MKLMMLECGHFVPNMRNKRLPESTCLELSRALLWLIALRLLMSIFRKISNEMYFLKGSVCAVLTLMPR